jgi:hypothetical protein
VIAESSVGTPLAAWGINLTRPDVWPAKIDDPTIGAMGDGSTAQASTEFGMQEFCAGRSRLTLMIAAFGPLPTAGEL